MLHITDGTYGSAMTTKHYASIKDVAAFGQPGTHRIELVDDLRVYVPAEPPYVEPRIYLAHDDIGALVLTTEQALELEDRLARAREDIDATLDSVTATDGASLLVGSRCECCECCGRSMPIGTLVATFWDDRGEVTMHWGRCPEPERWQIQWQLAEPTRWTPSDHWIRARDIAGRLLAEPYEDALSLARRIAKSSKIRRVLLVRARAEVANE